MTSAEQPRRTTHHAVCPHDCWDTCAVVAVVEDGKVIKVVGSTEHPTTRGFLCVKGNRLHERANSPDRVLAPLIRVGAKGEGRFREATWEEAIAYAAAGLQRTIDRHGPEAVMPWSFCGTMGLLQNGSMSTRFFHRMGATNLERTICSAAGSAGIKASLGAGHGPDPELHDQVRLFIVWGLNVQTSNVHQWPILQEARKQGARLVVIDPYKHATARAADLHLQIRPGTDTALALGLAHVILNEGLEDQDFLAQHAFGLDAFRQRVQEYPPERVAEITGIDAAVIRALAREYAATQPSLVRVGYGLQRQSHGGMAVRTIALLPALTGAWRHPAGGFLLSNKTHVQVGNLDGDHLRTRPSRSLSMNQLGAALLTESDPPVGALVVYNANPAVTAPDQGQVVRGLQRDDLFTVVLEQLHTDTVKYADVVLPATNCFEHLDLYTSYWHLYVQVSPPIVPPQGQALPNTEIFRRLAAAMGYNDPELQQSDEDLCRQALAPIGIRLEDLYEQKWVKIAPTDGPFIPYPDLKFPTPSGKVEFHSQWLERQGIDPLPYWEPPAESAAATPDLHAKYPINLISPAAHHFLNSTWANVPLLQSREAKPVIFLSPADAAERAVADGDWVRVFNDRGEVWLIAQVGDTAGPGSAISPTLWWNMHSPGGLGLNQLTSQRLTDLGRGASFHTNLIQVEKAPARPGWVPPSPKSCACAGDIPVEGRGR